MSWRRPKALGFILELLDHEGQGTWQVAICGFTDRTRIGSVDMVVLLLESCT